MYHLLTLIYASPPPNEGDSDPINCVKDRVSNIPPPTLQYGHWIEGGLWSRQNQYNIFCIKTWLLKMQKGVL